MKYIIIILALVSSNNLISQDIPEETKILMLEAMLNMDKTLLKIDTFIYKEEDYKKSDFFNEINSESNISSCLGMINSTGEIIIRKEEGESAAMYFTANLPEYYNKQLTDELKFKLKNYSLINTKGDSIKLLNQTNIEKSFSVLRIKTYKGNANTSIDGIKGFATYQIDFLTGYDQIEMSKEDVGKEFTLNNCSLKLVEVNGNYLAIENLSKQDVLTKGINFTENSQVILPYSYAALSEMKKNDESINANGYGTFVRVIKKPKFELLKSKKEVTLEDYKIVLTDKFRDRVSTENEIIIIKDVGHFNHKFIIYSPVYTSKEVRIEY